MAFLLMPLPRAATTAICSTTLLLAAPLHATSCAATALWSFSQTSEPPPSPFLQLLLIEDCSISPTWQATENCGTIIMPENKFWLQIALTTLSAPHQRCQHQIKGALLFTRRSKGTNDSSGASSDRRSSCTSHDFRPVTKSTLCKTSIMNISILSPTHQVVLEL